MAKPKTRGNGTGTAYRRGRVWEAQVILGWKVSDDGKTVPIKRRKSGFKTKKEALAACDGLLACNGSRGDKAPRLSVYWDSYQEGEYARLSKSKQVSYRIAWKKLAPLHTMPVDTISVNDLRNTVSSACPSYYPARDCKTLLTTLFKLAAADRWVDQDLPSFIVLPKLEEKAREPFSALEQAALWKLYESGDMRAAIPLLMIYTGMMPGEAQNLRVEHINLTTRTISGVGMKTDVRKKTPIVLSSAILPVVAALIEHAQPTGWIWRKVEADWYADYYAALEAAHCRRLTPYSCRHTTATALAISEGIAPQTVKQVMRWSTTRMLDRYAHAQTEDALDAVDALKRA